MRILNAKSPDVAAKLLPWFVATQTESRMQIANDLYGRLKDKPGDTFCAIAIENNIARAVLIAHVSESRRKSVWIWQARAEPGFKDSQVLFDALKTWAKEKKAKEIRMGANGRDRAFHRRWGFEDAGNGEMRLRI